MKKTVLLLLAVQLCLVLNACDEKNTAADGKISGEITVVSREDGSGTRSAFAYLAGITDSDGYDIIYDGAEITNSNAVMLTSVGGNSRAVGYASFGVLEKISGDAQSIGVKTVSVDGTPPSEAAVKSGEYKIARRFYLCFKKNSLSASAREFLNYVLSSDGQKIIRKAGFIPVSGVSSGVGLAGTGRIAVGGSTSVAPAIELLSESFGKLNPHVTVEIQQTGSSAGITSAIQGVCDFAMSSRALTESERKELDFEEIAMDAIAVIVNEKNGIGNMTSGELRAIFGGKIRNWKDLEKAED